MKRLLPLLALACQPAFGVVNIVVELEPNAAAPIYDTDYPDGDRPITPPEWISTPSPVFTGGVASSYNVAADYESAIPVTLTEGPGCVFPPGTSVEDSTKTIDATTGTSDGVTESCTLLIDDGVADPVPSPEFDLPILPVVEGEGLLAGPGQTYATVQDAAADAACGDTILVYDGADEHFETTRNCGPGAPITIKAQAGQNNVVVSEFATRGGEQANAHCLHTNWIIGEGMQFLGANPMIYQIPATDFDPPHNNVVIGANNCTFKGFAHRGGLQNVRLSNGASRTVFDGARLTVAGTHDRGNTPINPFHDVGSNVYMESSGDFTLFINSHMDAGGHNGWENGKGNRNVHHRIEDSLLQNNWDAYYVDGLNLNRGTRIGSLAGTGLTIRNSVFSDIRAPSEESGLADSTWKSTFNDGSVSGIFILDHHSGPAIGAGAIAVADSNPANQYWDHFTIGQSDGSCFSLNDNGARPAEEYGPFYYKNGICNLPSQVHNHTRYTSPVGTNNAKCIVIRFSTLGDANRDDWTTYAFFQNLRFSSDCPVRIQNGSGGPWAPGEAGSTSPGNYTLSDMMADYPGNFINVAVTVPNFVSTDVSESEDPATAIASAKANFLPQNANYLDCSECWLTQVDGAVSPPSVFVDVDDSNWLRDEEGWTQAARDQITLCGTTTRVENIVGNTLELEDEVECLDNAGVYRYTNEEPNIGAAQ